MVLPCSRHLFIRPVISMDQRAWVESHVQAFEFFRGCPRRIVPDNLKAGVCKPDLYDPKINRAYAELARHYGVLIDPARAYHPRDKPRVAYCTSSGRWTARWRSCRSLCVVPASLVEGRGVGPGRVVEDFAFVVIPLPADNSGVVPDLDSGGGHGEQSGYLVQGDEPGVEQQQPGDALAFAHRGGGVGPDAGQVCDEPGDLVLLGGGERAGVLLAGFVVGGLGVVERAEGGVPAGFECAGDEPVGGVDGEVAAAGQVGVVAGALDVGGAQRVGLGGALLELGGDLEGGFDGQRGEGVDEQLADALVEGVPGNQGAGAAPVFDAVAVAGVGGQFLAAAGVVADGHPQPAAAADDDALQEGGAFAGWPGGAVAAVRGGVGRQPGDVGLVLVQGDVSGVGAGDEGGPLVAGKLDAAAFPAGQYLLAAPTVGEHAGVAGVVQHPQDRVVLQRLPVDLALAGAFLVPPGEGQAGGAERLHDRGGRPGGLECGEQVGERAADGGVGVEDDVPGGVVDQADRQRHDELAAAGLGDLPAAQPGPDEMELG